MVTGEQSWNLSAGIRVWAQGGTEFPAQIHGQDLTWDASGTLEGKDKKKGLEKKKAKSLTKELLEPRQWGDKSSHPHQEKMNL